MTEKKLFGEFLVEKGVVSQGDLLDALLEQQRAMTPLPEFAYKQGGVSADSMLAAFRSQQMAGKDFMSALRECAGLSQEKLDSMLDAYSSSRKPIGELLVKRGVPLEKIIQAFDEFLNDHTHASSPAATEPSPAPSPALVTPAAAEIASPEPVPLAQEYLELSGGAEKRDLLLSRLNCLKQPVETLSKEAQHEILECTKTLHLLLGAARFLRLQKSEALLKEIEQTLLRLLKRKAPLPSTLPAELHDALGGAIRQVWEYREALASRGTEGDHENTGIREILQKLTRELMEGAA